jgi:hypothetical protein
VRDRRWDFLYERQKQPVKAWVLERFAEELARELEAWPPPFTEWVSEELRARWAAGAAGRPRDELVRRALALARLDLAREHDAYERVLLEDGPGRPRTPAEEAALQLLVVLLSERCLGLKEHADRLRLSRAELAGALDDVERRLFRVTLG